MSRRVSRYSVATVDAELRAAIEAAPRDPAWLRAVVAVVRDPERLATLAAVARIAPTPDAINLAERRAMLVRLVRDVNERAAGNPDAAAALLAAELPQWADMLGAPELRGLDVSRVAGPLASATSHKHGPKRYRFPIIAAWLCNLTGALKVPRDEHARPNKEVRRTYRGFRDDQ